MNNPYEVLGLKEGCSKEEIKSAYRELVKKYHPDQYAQNPLRDLAEEKLRDINEAYDYLMKNTADSNFSSFNAKTSNGSQGYGSTQYNDIRNDLNNGNMSAAEEKLNRSGSRTAEWYFLKGMVSLKKGWYDDAYSNIANACRMEPNNLEYRRVFNSLQTNNNTYRQPYYGRGNSDGNLCDICMTLWCADQICGCLGGNMFGC